jgi:hydrogenase nickel incorporation protein HypA/HybF
MHEIGLTQELLARAVEQASRRGAQRIVSVNIRVGAESDVAPDVVTLAFELFRRRTLAEDAQIAIETVPVVCWCPDCDREFSGADALHVCPHCALPGAVVRRGREFELVSLEVM